MVLERIKGPADVKRLSPDEMKTLAAEMRNALLHKVSARGGHFGPNFGMVEATIALHYVFNSPEDKIVFDVSHFCIRKSTTKFLDIPSRPKANMTIS